MDVLSLQSQKTAVNGLSVDNVNLSGHMMVGGQYGCQPENTSYTDGIVSKWTPDPAHKITGTSSSYSDVCGYLIDASHDHTLSGDTETRPDNYTIKIWKRTA